MADKKRGLDEWGVGPVHGASSAGRGWWQGEPLTVGDVMDTHVRAVPRHLPVVQIAELMRRDSVGAVPVVGQDERVVGIVTDRDIVVRGCLASRPLAELNAEDVMTEDVEVARSDETLARVVDRMAKCKVRRLPVLARHHRQGAAWLVGMLSLDDVREHAREEGDLGAALERLSNRLRKPDDRADSASPDERRSFFPSLWRRLRRLFANIGEDSGVTNR